MSGYTVNVTVNLPQGLAGDAADVQWQQRHCCVCERRLRRGNLYPTCNACYTAAWAAFTARTDDDQPAPMDVSAAAAEGGPPAADLISNNDQLAAAVVGGPPAAVVGGPPAAEGGPPAFMAPAADTDAVAPAAADAAAELNSASE